MRLLITTTVAVAILSMPVLAQTKAPAGGTSVPARSEAECQAHWKSADKNADGRLDAAEISAAKSVIPTALATTTTVNEQDFLSACKATVQDQKK